MMKKAWILISCLSLLVACCDDEAPVGQVDGFYFEETKCANPWSLGLSGNNDPSYLAAISGYLADSLEVEFSNLHITEEGEYELCEACTCKSGRYIRLDAEPAFEAKLLGAGFVKD